MKDALGQGSNPRGADDLHVAKRLRRALRPRTADVARIPRWIRRFGLAAKRQRSDRA
jgi:hypothetical protein